MDNQPQPTKPTNKALWIVLIIVVLAIAGYGIYAYISGNTNGNQNTNLVVNLNTNAVTNVNNISNNNAITNTVTNSNTNIIANTNVNTSGWKTYNSLSSSLMLFKNRRPSLSFLYPQDWRLDEELGGIYLSQSGHANLEPQMNISWGGSELTGNIMEECKKLNGWGSPSNPIPDTVQFDEERTFEVNEIAGVFVSYHLQSDNLGDSADANIVCLPTNDTTIVITGKPRGSDFIKNFFEEVISTIKVQS